MSKSWIWKDIFSKSYINKEINDYINGIKNDGPFIVYKNCCIFLEKIQFLFLLKNI
jgi:hypothetical protein